MPIPDFQSIMLPLLKVMRDGTARSSKEYRAQLAEQFQLTEAELAEQIPSRRAYLFANRVAWAIVYLQRADLISRPRRAHYQITDVGQKALASNPDKINIRYLKQYPTFNEWQNKSAEAVSDEDDISTVVNTPEEVLDVAYLELRSSLALELLDQVKALSPKFFEELVVKLLVNMGYGGSIVEAGMAIGKSGDGGIDGIIKEDHLGLDVIYIQAKRWEGTVGSPEVQKFAGALQGKHAQKGVFLTTGTFAHKAYHFVETIGSKVVLIDGKRLAELMIDFNVGMTTKDTYLVKRVDYDFFTEE